MPDKDSSISWQAATHEYKERSADWFWGLGVAALIGAVLAVFFGNLLLSVIIVLGGFMIGFLAIKEPRMCDISVSSQGVRIDHSLYPYRSLKSFSIDDESREIPQLIVMTNSLLNPELVLPLEEHVDQQKVREILLSKLPEEDHVESPLARIADMLGF